MVKITKTELAQRMALLSLYASGCTAMRTPCESYPSPVYKDVGMECSGPLVKQVPRMLPNGLQMLLLTGTAISSLDNDTFQGRDLTELRTLSVTEGQLASVGPDAFCSLPALTMLYLDHNRLDKLDELSFMCNTFLRIVSLMDNPSLRHLPRMVSSSVEHLYIDNCSLSTIDVATMEDMTALKVLSLIGNGDLNCPSVKTQFKQSRHDLLVICEDPVGDPTFSGAEQLISEKSFTDLDIAIMNTKKYTVGDEYNTSYRSFTELDVPAMATTDNQIIINLIFGTVIVFSGICTFIILVKASITMCNYCDDKI